MIRIDLSTLVHAKVGQRQTVMLDFGDTVLGDLHLAYLKGEVQFTRLAHGILAQGKPETEVETECIRCLTPFFVPITIELEDLISLPGADLTAERPVRVTEDGWADLAPLIREYAWLGLPINPICSENCQPLCPHCGGNINKGECVCDDPTSTDPRWEALRSLL